MQPPVGGDSFKTHGGVSYSSAAAPIEISQDGVRIANARGWTQAPQNLEGSPNEFPRWFKVGTVSYKALLAAALTGSINLFKLPAKATIHCVKIKHSVAFAGPSISAYTVSVGISGSLAKYASAFDVFQASASGAFQVSSNCDGEDSVSDTQVLLTATAVGANLNVATAGSVDIWAMLSKNDG